MKELLTRPESTSEKGAVRQERDSVLGPMTVEAVSWRVRRSRTRTSLEKSDALICPRWSGVWRIHWLVSEWPKAFQCLGTKQIQIGVREWADGVLEKSVCVRKFTATTDG